MGDSSTYCRKKDIVSGIECQCIKKAANVLQCQLVPAQLPVCLGGRASRSRCVTQLHQSVILKQGGNLETKLLFVKFFCNEII